MSIIGSNILAGASGQAGGGGAYEISRSVRFNSSDSAYLSKSYTTSGSRRKATISIWCKRSKLGDNGGLFLVSDGSSSTFTFVFKSDDKIQVYWNNGAANLSTASVFRDLSAWYHIVLVVDTDNATASDRAVVYVNGVRNTLSGTFPTQGSDTELGLTGSWVHTMGMHPQAGSYKLNGYLADIHFIDGQALDPTSFGEFDTNNVWQPIEYTGTFGTNGFHLPLSDNSTAAALGTDTSSNGNTWTVNNISVTAGAGNDSLVDSPVNGSQVDTGAGGEVVGNYATLNPIDPTTATLSNGNLDCNLGNAATHVRGTIQISSGKWYWEITPTSLAGNMLIGICVPTQVFNGDLIASGGFSYYNNGNKYSGGSASSYGASYTVNDVIGVAFDADAGTLTYYKNGVSQGTAFTGLTAEYFPAVSDGSSGSASSFVVNFGQRAFAYQTPGTNRPASTYKALCTTNLPEPTIADGSTAMDVALYTGNGSTQTISGLNFSPDLVWIKQRSTSRDHCLCDVVRGTSKRLRSNTTDAETTESVVTAFNSNGFDIGSDAGVNASSGTYAAWTWDAGSSTVTNTQGSISSQVRANASAGFSVVTYTGTLSSAPGTAPTVGHGLGVKPALIISKSRNNAGGESGAWYVNHGYNYNNFLRLNTTAAAGDISANGGGTEADPTSTVFSTYYINGSNVSGATYVAYCFAPVAGYSSFGSYVGNSSATDGPFVYTGFRIRWLMIKVTNISGESWVMKDAVRNTYNPVEANLYSDLSAAEQTSNAPRLIDFTSNGFKLRGNEVSVNDSSNTYIYMAFAENSFQYARAR